MNSTDYVVTVYNNEPLINYSIPDLYAKFETNFETLIPIYHFMDVDAEYDTTFSFTAKLKNGSQLSDWMVFSKKTRTFYGLCPLLEFKQCLASSTQVLDPATIAILPSEVKIKDQDLLNLMVSKNIPVRYKECYYPISVTAFDDHANITTNFTLVIYDYAPIQKSKIYNEQQSIRLHTRRSVVLYITDSIFGDLDLEDSWSLYLDVYGNSTLPDWYALNQPIKQVVFYADPSILSSAHCPTSVTSNFISKGGSVQSEYRECVFTLRIIATDLVFNETVTLTATVFNEGPYSNRPIYAVGGVAAQFVLSVTKTIDYIFPSDAFLDADDTARSLIYSIRNGTAESQVPAWLMFIPKFRRFMGKPASKPVYFEQCTRQQNLVSGQVRDISGQPVTLVQEYCLLELQVVVTDGVFEAYQNFTLYVYNNLPYNYQSLLSEVDDPEQLVYYQNNNTIRTHVGLLFEFNIPLQLFKESDENQYLNYFFYVFDKGEKVEPSDFWLTFDASALRVYGVAFDYVLSGCEAAHFHERKLNVTDVYGANVTNTEQFCDVYVQVAVTDSFLKSYLPINFTVRVYNFFPYVYYPVHTQADYATNFKHFHYNEYMFFQLSPLTIQDMDSLDRLKITFYHNYSSDVLTWLKFDTSFRYFFGQPEIADLYSLCPSRKSATENFYHVLEVADQNYPTPGKVLMRQHYCNFTITIVVEDPYSFITQDVNFSIYNNNPYPYTPMHVLEGRPAPVRVHVDTTFEVNFPMETLLDDDMLDKIYLKYTLVAFTHNNSQEIELPEWIKFNYKNLRIAGQAPKLEYLDTCPPTDFVVNTFMNKVKDWRGQYVPLHESGCRIFLKLTLYDRVELASQFMELIVQNYKPYQYAPVYLYNEEKAAWRIHVTALSEYVIPRDIFKDVDNDRLSVRLMDSIDNSSQKVPQWLRYEAKLRRLLANPAKNYNGSYNVSFEITDQYQVIYSDIQIIVYNHGPEFLGFQTNFYLTIGQLAKVKFPTASLKFRDLDNDPITIEFFCVMNYQDLPLSQCNSYVYFDQKRLFFTANPTKYSNIPFFPERQEYYEQTVIKIKITDTNDEFNTTTFSVIVQHKIPTLNPNSPTLQHQFNQLVSSQQVVPKPGELVEFTYSRNTFSYEDIAVTYSARERLVTPYPSPIVPNQLEYSFGPWEAISQYSSFWLKFDAKNRKFYGIPGKDDMGHFQIEVVISDNLGNCTQSFFVNITNTSPRVVGKLANYSFVFGQRSVYVLVDPFVFDDQDDELSRLSFTAVAEYHVNATRKNIRRQLNQYYQGYWLKYDPVRNLLFGTPTTSNIEFNTTDKKFFMTFKITITCSDSVGAVNASFYLTIYNHCPYFSGPLLQPTFDSKYRGIQTSEQFSMSMPRKSYRDDDGDRLAVKVKVNNYQFDEYPDWFDFDYVNWIIKIVPKDSQSNTVINLTFVIADRF